jgi:hypothetical protein
MRLIYIDDSGDDLLACYSALAIDATNWNACESHLESMRGAMNKAMGIYTSRELHAREFLTGRGRISDKPISKEDRVRAGRAILQWITRLPSVQIFNVVMGAQEKETAFDWLLNRIDRTMVSSGDVAMLISDNGKNYNAMLTRKRKQNDIPSMFGGWGGGSYTANIPISRIVERIAYRDSASCNFIQAADFCAYALLRKEHPLESQAGQKLETLFEELDPVLVKVANATDPHGIIRRRKTA